VESGVRRTPTFFINDLLYEGPAEFAAIVAALESSAKPA
jgi:protein-disulfide isomerase